MREILIRWIEEAAKLQVGEALFLPATSKAEQDLLHSALVKEVRILHQIDPALAATVSPFKTFKNGRFWVGLNKVLAVPTLGFVKTADGTIQKVTLPDIDPERQRRIRLMCEDGLSLDMIEELEGPLSQTEREEIITGKEE